MRHSTCFALSALFVPAALIAQAPEAAQPTFSQRLRAEAPEVEKLLAAFHSREAQTRIEAVLPAQIPAFDKANPQASLSSYQNYREYVYGYFLAAKSADQAGHWERAQEHFAKAKELAETNASSVKESFPPIVDYYKNLAEQSKRVLAENADFIKSLQAKAEPDPGEKQQLDLIKGEEASIEKNLKMAKTFEDYIDGTRKEAEYYASLHEQMVKQIDMEKESLATYKFKDDKEKYVEGIVISKTYLEQFTQKSDKVRYLYRLNVLSPENKKVIRLLKDETGVELEGSEKAEPTSPKKKKK